MRARRHALVLLVVVGLVASAPLRAAAGPAFDVVVLGDAGGLAEVSTHVEPSLQRGETPRERIARELRETNPYGVRFVLATQGAELEL